jgi:ABC-type transporter MlaC component
MPDRAAAEELRDLIREAHSLLKDMRAEKREIKQLLDGIPARVDARIEDRVRTGLEVLGKETKKAMDASVAKVTAEFDRLESILTGTERTQRRQGKRPLEDLIREHVEKGGGHV